MFIHINDNVFNEHIGKLSLCTAVKRSDGMSTMILIKKMKSTLQKLRQ